MLEQKHALSANGADYDLPFLFTDSLWKMENIFFEELTEQISSSTALAGDDQSPNLSSALLIDRPGLLNWRPSGPKLFMLLCF